MTLSVPADLRFDERGLLPVIVQDAASGDVLMMAWADAPALERTAATGEAHFWSRSRQAPWRKGETSGHSLRVQALRTDCDRDVVLLLAEPQGPTCHTGARSCFGEESPTGVGVLAEVAAVIAERETADPAASYTARLLSRGPDAVLKKIGEEATEVVLAGKGESDARLAEEAADLLFHLLLALHQRRVPLAAALAVLRARRR